MFNALTYIFIYVLTWVIRGLQRWRPLNGRLCMATGQSPW